VTDPLVEAVTRLRAAGIDNPRLEARLLWEYAQSSSRFEQLLIRRIAREPLAYIIGHKEFFSLDFEVGPGVLVPRPETETLLEQALAALPDRFAPLRILDLGTGSGCLLVAALCLYPNATGTGMDASADALVWARRNLIRHGCERRATLVEGDWAAAAGAFDLVLCNPPYVTAADIGRLAPELAREPRRALEAGADGLAAYRALGPVLARLLAPAGRAFVEIGAGQGPGATAVLEASGLEILGIAPDLSGIPRALEARLPA
jgi:release factor glutamine methyltransferase